MSLMPVEDALARIVDGVAPTGTETVPIGEAQGRVLATALNASHDQPPFDASAMDGYAIRRADLTNGRASLRLVGQSAAGHGFTGTLGTGDAVRIFTGAPVPAGADGIVIQENASASGETVDVEAGAAGLDHIRPRGFDFDAGSSHLAAGRVLGPREITLAAALGHGALPVLRQPRVAILATGDELVWPGETRGPDQIYCSNPFGVASLVRSAGGVPTILGIARDTAADLDAQIGRADGFDVLVTIGGASVGDHDLVAGALEARGFRFEVARIAMRPGKPLLFARKTGTRALGLPGNPVSSLICARVFLVPLVQRLLGLPAGLDVPRPAIADHAIEANGPRMHFMRAIATRDGGGAARVRLVPSQDSSLLASLADANALVVRPVGAPAVPAGGEVGLLALDF